MDIDKGDLVSFYFNGRLWDLYTVESKFIPKTYKKTLARGHSYFDPVEVSNGKEWRSIATKYSYIYFPFRLKLIPIRKTTFDTSLVFKPGLERLGINLVPRISLRKSHFQLRVNDAKAFFGDFDTQEPKELSLSSFVDCGRRSQSRAGKGDFKLLDFSVDELTHIEIYLQALLKKLLEWSWDSIAPLIDLSNEPVEFLSEQTVHGGEADLTVLFGEKELLIEVKNTALLKSNRQLYQAGQAASGQVRRYRSLTHGEDGTVIGIAGKAGGKNLVDISRVEDRVYKSRTSSRETVFPGHSVIEVNAKAIIPEGFR